jgi:TPR repeat protein
LPTVLPIPVVLLLLVSVVLAQDRLPASTQARLATAAHLEALALPDFTKVMFKAQSGDREAPYLMALIYLEGRLVPRDFAMARSWMLKSAEQGYVPAQAGMGEMYLNGIRHNGVIPDYVEAERWLHLAATQGDADAQLWLGNGYEREYFGTLNHREALRWLRKAAAQGLPDAQFSLGQMYEDGAGVPKSDAMAASWYRRAADHFPEEDLGGVWEAEIQLAEMYRDGRLPNDYVEAYMWFAIVGSGVVPPADDDMKWAAQHMTKAQIAKAQRMAEGWTRRHRRQGPTSGDNSLDHAQPAK